MPRQFGSMSPSTCTQPCRAASSPSTRRAGPSSPICRPPGTTWTPDPLFGGEDGKAWRVRRYSRLRLRAADAAACSSAGPMSPTTSRSGRTPMSAGSSAISATWTEQTVQNPLFRDLIAWDFAQWPIEDVWLDLATWVCQVHQIRIHVVGGHTSDVTPEGVHSDGYPFARRPPDEPGRRDRRRKHGLQRPTRRRSPA